MDHFKTPSKSEAHKEAQRIGFALLMGLVIGLIIHFMNLGAYVDYVKPIGTVFIRLLKMVIVPLVLSSIFMAIINLGDPKSLGTMGKRAFLYYFVTTSFAVLVGLIFVNIVQPGVGVDLANEGLDALKSAKPMLATQVENNAGLWGTIQTVLIGAIPTNPFYALANMEILQVIVFALIFGVVALYYKKEAEPVVKLMGSLESLSLNLTHGLMKIAPLGIFVLMLDVMAKAGVGAIYSLSKYILTVLIGLFCHAGILVTLATIRLKRSPISILKDLSAPLLTAFSTSSSAATLPVTMATVEENLGVNKETAKFVLPLGATVNMDGTALYESVAAIFIAQAYGIDLSIGAQIIVFLTASLAAVGAAAIPGAGLITMSIVLTTVGLPIEGIGLIFAVDRLLDMFRTAINVLGDCVGSIIVDSTVKGKDKSA
ncbi:MAG: dicarboxylate/amino acid:cation symporter [Bacteriovoracaceae bacterium]